MNGVMRVNFISALGWSLDYKFFLCGEDKYFLVAADQSQSAIRYIKAGYLYQKNFALVVLGAYVGVA